MARKDWSASVETRRAHKILSMRELRAVLWSSQARAVSKVLQRLSQPAKVLLLRNWIVICEDHTMPPTQGSA